MTEGLDPLSEFLAEEEREIREGADKPGEAGVFFRLCKTFSPRHMVEFVHGERTSKTAAIDVLEGIACHVANQILQAAYQSHNSNFAAGMMLRSISARVKGELAGAPYGVEIDDAGHQREVTLRGVKQERGHG